MILLQRLYDPYSSSEELIRYLILTAVLCPALAAVFVALRFYTARAILRGVHRDDCKTPRTMTSNLSDRRSGFILSALVFSMGFSSVEILRKWAPPAPRLYTASTDILSSIETKQYGLGKYRDEIPREHLRYMMKMYMLVRRLSNSHPPTWIPNTTHFIQDHSLSWQHPRQLLHPLHKNLHPHLLPPLLHQPPAQRRHPRRSLCRRRVLFPWRLPGPLRLPAHPLVLGPF